MKKLLLAAPLAVLMACGSTPGYMNSDVLEPEGLGAATPTGVKFTNNVITDGTLTSQGPGDVQKAYKAYVEAMRDLGWESKSADGDAVKGLQCSLRKDTRQVDVSITPEGQGAIKVVIKIGPGR
jgi:hypothetical protein